MAQAIRQATRDDAAMLAALVREAFAPVAARLGITRATWPTFAAFTPPERVRELMDQGFRYAVLDEAAGPCGCIAFKRFVPDPSLPCDAQPRIADRPVEVDTVHLRHLAVRPAHQGRGAGQALLGWVVAEARRLGARQVSLGIVGNDLPLEHWYARRGFTVTGTRAYDEVPCPVTWMALAL